MDIKNQIIQQIKENEEEAREAALAAKKNFDVSLESDIVLYICLTKDPETLRDYLNGKKVLSYPWPQEKPGYKPLVDDRAAEDLFKKLKEEMPEDFSFSRDSFREAFEEMLSVLSLNYKCAVKEPRDPLFLKAEEDARAFLTRHCSDEALSERVTCLVNSYGSIDSCMFSSEKRESCKKEALEALEEEEGPVTALRLCASLFGGTWREDISEASRKYGISFTLMSKAVLALNRSRPEVTQSRETFYSFMEEAGKALLSRISSDVPRRDLDLLSDDFHCEKTRVPFDPLFDESLNALIWMMNTPDSGPYVPYEPDFKTGPCTPLSRIVSDMSEFYDTSDAGGLLDLRDFFSGAASSYLYDRVKDIPSMYALAEDIPGKNLGYACEFFDNKEKSFSTYFAEMIVWEGTPEDLAFFLKDNFPLDSFSSLENVPEEVFFHLFESLKDAFLKEPDFAFDRAKTRDAVRDLSRNLGLDGEKNFFEISREDALSIACFVLDLSLVPECFPDTSAVASLGIAFERLNAFFSENGGYTKEQQEKVKRCVFEKVEEPLLENRPVSASFLVPEDVRSFVDEALEPVSLDNLLKECEKEEKKSPKKDRGEER